MATQKHLIEKILRLLPMEVTRELALLRDKLVVSYLLGEEIPCEKSEE